MKSPTKSLPDGWDEQRVREVPEHYERQTDHEAAAEHEVALSQLDPDQGSHATE